MTGIGPRCRGNPARDQPRRSLRLTEAGRASEQKWEPPAARTGRFAVTRWRLTRPRAPARRYYRYSSYHP